MELEETLGETRALGAQWSISVRRDDEPTAFLEHSPRTLLRTASVAKIFVLLELADRLSRGALDPGQLVDRRSTPPVHDSGLWHAMRVEALPVADLAVLVGAVSDNWATNALIDVCGLERIRARAADAAPGGSMLHDYVRDDRSSDVPETLSEGCAEDWAGIMQRLHHERDADAARLVLSWLAQNADLSMVAAGFDLDPLAHDTDDLGLRLWHKTGTDPGVRADVGLIRSRSRVVSYAVVCNWPAGDDDAQVRRAVLAAMRRLGEQIGTCR